jgi:hypothetical protein
MWFSKQNPSPTGSVEEGGRVCKAADAEAADESSDSVDEVVEREGDIMREGHGEG